MRESLVVVVTTVPLLNPSTLDLASRLAQRANAVLQFLHVIPIDLESQGPSALHTALEGAAEDRATRRWHPTLQPSDGSVRFRHHLEVGRPEDVIRSFVSTHDVHLLVIEEPPRSVVSETLWRGLAERLIRAVDCPVVIGGPGFLRAAPRVKPPIYTPVSAATTSDLLNAMVEARVDALRNVLDHLANTVRRLAGSETVKTAVMLAGKHRGMIEARIEQRLNVEMNEHRQACRAIGWRLVTEHRVWASHDFMGEPGPPLVDFLARVRHHGAAASLPTPSLQDPHQLLILAGAEIRLADGAGLLSFAFDAEDDFLRILGQPGPLPTFETYAFDRSGMMLSNTQFPGELAESGILRSDDHQTPLRVRVAEPSAGPMTTWPLTLMAQEATNQRDGHDTSGYLDYRGKPVMGAWRWLPDYGFGVAAEIDVER